ncbi:hypothetical protein QWJ34_16295 [Saccharibacillus sp. CPCC 101409]|uniref:hypothetical protein n=1 Tax=Saccharibacillus sp. CPCC 101409 TaxID=3058041 RepID=UPI002671FB69|nr:hypothetical protein [Saccharibacillus sp. CPCC 101409]MDO3411327.1 hypothetical protein [Saccharibacillus sp. CPCC 101409]
MSGYDEIESILRKRSQANVLILDTNNIQFYFQHRDKLTAEFIFAPYDLILIPEWVQNEYEHHSGKREYVNDIPNRTIVVRENEDYLPMLEYRDRTLFELLRVASPFQESQRFFNRYRKFESDELPDDWIERFYEEGFFTRNTETSTTKKNAGEVSIISLCFCLPTIRLRLEISR